MQISDFYSFSVYLTIVLVLCAAFFNAMMDVSAEGNFKNHKLNKNTSASNKWKEYDARKGQQEKFPGSSTVFVFVTDLWHFSQFMYNNCWQIAIAIHLPHPIISFVVLKTAYSGLFELIYRRIKRR
jgi:hypothetical protein